MPTKEVFRDEYRRVTSKRLFTAPETLSSNRRKLPVIVLNLDGLVGFWDDSGGQAYVLRQRIVDSLIQLSFDFRLVAVSVEGNWKIRKAILGLMNIVSSSYEPTQDV